MSQTYRPLFINEKRLDGYFYDPSSDIIHFIKSMDGQKVKFSTKVKRPFHKKAMSVANVRLKEIFGDKRVIIQPLINDEIPKYKAFKKSEDLDPKTMQKITQAFARIEPYWGGMFPREINDDTVAGWHKWLDEKFPGQQKFNAIKYFKGLCRYMNRKQFEGMPLLPAIPLIRDPKAKEHKATRKKKTDRIFTRKEFRRILLIANQTERLAAAIMYTMATRIEETLEMSFSEQVVKVPGGWKYVWSHGQNKADLDGSHEFPTSLTGMLNVRVRVGHVRLFPQSKDTTKALKPQQIDWDDWRSRADLGWHWTSKTFRHTCLSNLFSDPKYAQAVICSQYRVSLKVALETYVKATEKSKRSLKNASDAWS